MNKPEYELYHELKSHSPDSFPFNTYPCYIPLDFHEVPIHWHNSLEIIYIKSGRGTVSLNFVKHYIEAGDIIIVLSGQLHGISRLEQYSMKYENIIFSPDMLMTKPDDSLNGEFFTPFLSGYVTYPPIIDRDHPLYPELSACLNHMDALGDKKPKGYKLAIKAQLFQFMYILYTNSEDVKVPENHYNMDKIKTVLSYVEEHYKDTITIEEISCVCGFSQSHFMRFFKQTLHTSFVEYLNDYRLNAASRMLLSSDNTILSIATESGFDNLSNFNRLFKRKYGVTPSSYRLARQC